MVANLFKYRMPPARLLAQAMDTLLLAVKEIGMTLRRYPGSRMGECASVCVTARIAEVAGDEVGRIDRQAHREHRPAPRAMAYLEAIAMGDLGMAQPPIPNRGDQRATPLITSSIVATAQSLARWRTR